MSFTVAHYITRRARIGPLDAQIVFPVLLWLLHPRAWTSVILLIAILLLWYLSSKGINLMMMGRIVRRWLVGNHREIRSPWRKHFDI